MPSIFTLFRRECERLLRDAISKAFPSIRISDIRLEPPPSLELGELGSSICLEIAISEKAPPSQVAQRVVENIDTSSARFVRSVEVAGTGYVNFHLDYDKITGKILEEAILKDKEFGLEKTEFPKQIIVEHTSANPSGPLHLGQARNAILGDALARLLRARGHGVKTHFYIDDVGKQVAILAYGYELIGRPVPRGKPDHWLGLLYSCTNCAVQLRTLKSVLDSINQTQDRLDKNMIIAELDEWMSIARSLRGQDAELYDKVMARVESDLDPLESIERIVRNYEQHHEATVSLVREVVNLCIEGIRQTLNQARIYFDRWDWESDLVWSGAVGRVVGALSGSGYTFEEDGALMLDANRIVNELDLRRTLGLSPEVAVPPLTLMRKDKTTLYITRDIAYTIMKFQQANKIVNVIGVEQKLVQLQLKLAISALLGKEKAQDLVHYAYGLVELPGVKMSRRRSMYITFDEIIEQAFEKAKEHVKQSEDVSAEEMIEVARKIALGAIRYAMLNTSSTKTITFTWDRVLSLEKNSGPFINYAFTRACGILRKVGPLIPNPNYSLLKDPLERFLILQIAKFPDTVSEAADQLQPERVASFANTIAEKFHEYYEKVRVIGAERPELTYARAYLIKALQIVLRNAASLLGIELSERM